MTEKPSQQLNTQVSQMASLPAYLVLFAKGVAMGVADSVPGVSGGTVAVITNIYDRLIYSIKAVDLIALRLFFSGQFKEFWRHINGSFLLVLALAILTGLSLSANTVLYLIDSQFELLMAFFVGLVLASSWLLKSRCSLTRWPNLLALLIGVSLTLAVSFLSPVNVELSLIYLFFCGGIAICAMILPGVSGAFLLLMLGAYEFVLRALTALDLVVILVFMAGAVIGLLLFSRLIGWALMHYHELSYGFLTGMLIASVKVLWPWQLALNYYIDSDGKQHALQSTNILPINYEALTGNDPKVIAAVACFSAGMGLVLCWERFFGQQTD